MEYSIKPNICWKKEHIILSECLGAFFSHLEARNSWESVCILMHVLVYNYIYPPLPYFIMVSKYIFVQCKFKDFCFHGIVQRWAKKTLGSNKNNFFFLYVIFFSLYFYFSMLPYFIITNLLWSTLNLVLRTFSLSRFLMRSEESSYME